MRKMTALIMVLSFSVSGFAAENRSTRDKTDGVEHKKKNSVLAPVHNERYEYYDVCGCSEKDLQCDLTQKAIRCNDGKKYDSVTNWKVKWDYDYKRDSESCSTDSFVVTVDIVFRLPKWVRDANAPQFLIDKWDSYMKNLVLHEIGHRNRALEAAHELTQAVSEIPAARSCWRMDREVQKLCRARMQKLIREQEEYDAVTNHGYAQGVVFP